MVTAILVIIILDTLLGHWINKKQRALSRPLRFSVMVSRSPLSRLTKLQRWLGSCSPWNFSTALPLFHLSVSGSCFIAVKCYSFSLPPEIDCTFTAAANPGPAARSFGASPSVRATSPQNRRPTDAGLNEAFILSGERTMSQVKYCSTTDGRTAAFYNEKAPRGWLSIVWLVARFPDGKIFAPTPSTLAQSMER